MNKFIVKLDKEIEVTLEKQVNQALKKITLAECMLKNKTYGINLNWELRQIERMRQYVKKWKYLPGSYIEILEAWTVPNSSKYLPYIVDKKYL